MCRVGRHASVPAPVPPEVGGLPLPEESISECPRGRAAPASVENSGSAWTFRTLSGDEVSFLFPHTWLSSPPFCKMTRTMVLPRLSHPVSHSASQFMRFVLFPFRVRNWRHLIWALGPKNIVHPDLLLSSLFVTP